MSLRDLYAKELGYRDSAALKNDWEAKPEGLAKAMEGLVHAHIHRLIAAIEKQQQPKGSEVSDV